MGIPRPLTSPQVWADGDYLGRKITISMFFNENTHAMTGVTVVRDPGCLYRTIYCGVGEDGSPDTTTRQFSVPFGETNVSKGQLSSNGIDTIEDMLGVSFTVGP